MDLPAIQQALHAEGLEAWLLYDFKGQNPIARQVLRLPPETMLTRRFFCLLQPDEPPRFLLHGIELSPFEGLPGERHSYRTWRELQEGLKTLLGDVGVVAMEYSPLAAIPTASHVDGGTLELVRSTGVEVVSSADLVQAFAAPWTAHGLETHKEAARFLTETIQGAFRYAGEQIRQRGETTERAIQEWILDRYNASNFVHEGGPIVATGANAGNPHYETGPDHSSPIRAGDVLLLDLWAKKRGAADAVYGDITWMGCCGEPSEKLIAVWETVRDARDAALRRIEELWAADGEGPRGFHGDRAARQVISDAGYGEQFIHRTGHSLGPQDHWLGANIDDYETKDERKLIPGTGFTIEPGIYLPELGVRSEIDVYMSDHGPVVTTPPQRELFQIL